MQSDTPKELKLSHDLAFSDLYEREGLVKLDRDFLSFLGARTSALKIALDAARENPEGLSQKQESDLLIELGPHVDAFIAGLFGIERELEALSARHLELEPLYRVKRAFVQRKAASQIKPEEAAKFDGDALALALGMTCPVDELAFANQVAAWQKNEPANAGELKLALSYAAWALWNPEGRERHRSGVLFKTPHKLDYNHLVPAIADERDGHKTFRLNEHRRREGFQLTDPGTDLIGALDEAHYCIWCHNQGKDSCSKGLKEKTPKGSGALSGKAPIESLGAGQEKAPKDTLGARQEKAPKVTPGTTLADAQRESAGLTSAPTAAQGAARFKKSPFGVTLAGCPLEEKISEFHYLKTQGHVLATLAIICVDNPMVAATGHRICNDCMKSCIYQKQAPVDIPQAETRSLKDVLEMPWGFEIYSLLTRWNPLDLRRPYPKLATGKRVLIVGTGPAGFTLAHHLMNDGHTVVGIDGLKIEPLAADYSGSDVHGQRTEFKAIRDVSEIYESLDDRVMAGFGGVAEYGITVRWDKNFLKLIRLLLERREQFSLIGGVRFGGTLTVNDSFTMGFDHIAIAAGAGRPTVLDMPNGLARGVRAASDFLMALQLTGAAKKNSIANLQLRLPVVVIGGGLTAIDTATEALAYYPVQVEKFLARYDTLVREKGEIDVRALWNEEERAIADEYLAHARAIRAERDAASKEGRAPKTLELLQSWGGVKIAYRRRLIDSPSYTLNHEEVHKALEEGIEFAEGLSPLAIEVDQYAHASAIRMHVQKRNDDGKWIHTHEVTLPARSILIAAGTHPNTVLGREEPEHFALEGEYFQARDEHGNVVHAEYSSAKPAQPNVLLSKREDGRYISFFGDVHPSFFGNVVKAMGGAKQGYPVVSHLLDRVPAAANENDGEFLAGLNAQLRATVHEVNRLTHEIVEVVVKAPIAAQRFRPGQFYRLQNFETLSHRANGTLLAMEGLAMTGAWVDKAAGLISTIVLEMGGSSDLCALLKPGEPVILMGPTGTPTEIPCGETVLLAGGGLGNAVLFSIGQALKAKNNRVLYFAAYRKISDRYKVAEIEAASDVIVWCCEEAPGFESDRAQDFAFVGNIVQAMAAYAQGELGSHAIAMQSVDRIIAIGSDRMMAAVAAARHGVLKPHLDPKHFAIGSINSPMQCMMKEICAQCLQPHVDPETGKTNYVFSCFNQDQPLDCVDFNGLNARLKQNSVQEKLTAQWIARCLAHLGDHAV